jgi:hypothetical protein
MEYIKVAGWQLKESLDVIRFVGKEKIADTIQYHDLPQLYMEY